MADVGEPDLRTHVYSNKAITTLQSLRGRSSTRRFLPSVFLWATFIRPCHKTLLLKSSNLWAVSTLDKWDICCSECANHSEVLVGQHLKKLLYSLILNHALFRVRETGRGPEFNTLSPSIIWVQIGWFNFLSRALSQPWVAMYTTDNLVPCPNMDCSGTWTRFCCVPNCWRHS